VSSVTLSGGDQEFHALVRIGAPDDERADAMGIAEGHEPIARDHRDHGIRALHALVDPGDRLEDEIRVQALAIAAGILQLVREDVQQDLGIRVGVDVAAVGHEELAAQLLGIHQVAVVRERDAERGIHVERLRLGFRRGRARGRIAAVRDAHVADEVAHVARAEHVAHEPAALVHVEAVALGRDDAPRRPARDAAAPSSRHTGAG
jgi:hypothetical protein